ncbi:MAG: type VI secretion system baseplate subunit TssF [Fibromonadales bacterium]|nr:type VI secretion system baseplate subunit TssF [Fibromonadales bacterium]
MVDFYEQELKILQNLKKDFDSSYKNAELNFDSEQLLFGLATLTARIRREMAETESEIARDFVESVAPEMLLPLPARCLAEIIPSPSDNRERTIPSGAMLFSKGKKEKPFLWRVVGEHKLNPAQKIISVKADEDCLEFESTGCGPWIIFINGGWDLWRLMLEHAKPYIIAKPQNPWELCRDFFCFEEKFRYIYMENLPKKLRFSRNIPVKICAENFKLNVLPIENAFEQNLDPVLLESGAFEAKIFPNEERQIILRLTEVLAGNAKKASFKEIKYRYDSGEIRFADLPPNSDMLSIAAIVCDGNFATAEALQVKNSAMQMCEVRSVIDVRPFLPCAESPEWEILGLLQQNYLRFFEKDVLKNALCRFETRSYIAQNIKSVSLEHKNAVYKGCLVPLASVKIILSLDYTPVLHAFGEMLYELFKKIFICNMLVELILRVEPYGMELKWE